MVDEAAQAADDMAETMYNANGVGLAAPRVAVLRRVVVMDWRRPDRNGQLEILETEGEQDGPEGCLSCRAAAAWSNAR
ncbi:MAG: peptide deformylase [Christensenellales bacterium]